MVNGASFVGRVVSNRMQKTVVVAVDRLVWVPKLKVFERRTSRLLAHCDAGEGMGSSGGGAATAAAAGARGQAAAAAAAAARATQAAAQASPSSAAATTTQTAPPSSPPSPLHVGDVVRVRWCPRVSRRKAYRVERVLRRARVYSPTLGEQALEDHRARRAAEEAAEQGSEAAGGARVARAEAALALARRRLAELRGEQQQHEPAKASSSAFS
jgi:ribosomal protein S17